ncbi:alpha/beta fold hydrolase [Streptomyces sp. SD15]
MNTPRNPPSPSTSSYKNASTRSVSVSGIERLHAGHDRGDGSRRDAVRPSPRVRPGRSARPVDGRFIAQVIAKEEPRLVRKVIFAGTGPAGGPGIDKVPALTVRATLKGALTRQDPKLSLFFTETAGGRRAGRAFLERLKERTHHRDKDISLPSVRAQLKAIKQWGRQAPSDLSHIRQPVLIANGENDRMMPSQNTLDLAARLPQSELVRLYRDSGHGGIFQYHDEFVTRALEFLES